MHCIWLQNVPELIWLSSCNHIRIIQHVKNCGVKGEAIAKSGPCCSCPTIYPHLEDVDNVRLTALHISVVKHDLKAVAFLLRCSKSLADMPVLEYVLSPEKLTGKGRIGWIRAIHYAIRHEKECGDMC